MRTTLAALLIALLLPLAACDSGNDAPTIRVTEPSTVQLVAERDSLVVDLTTVFQSDSDQPLRFEIVLAPAGTVLRNGNRLVVPPQPPGAVQAEVRASLSAYATAKATLHATYAYLGKITAAKAFDPIALDAQKDSAVYDLATYFAVPPGIAATYTVSGAGASVSGTMLKVKPSEGGTSNVAVRAGAPGIEAATATIALTAKSDWCATAPAGTVDLLPFQVGETVRFRYSYSASSGGSYTSTSDNVVWAIQSRSCSYGSVSLGLLETTKTGTQRVSASIPRNGPLPQIGMYAQFHPDAPRFVPTDASGGGTLKFGSLRSGGEMSYTVQGLQKIVSYGSSISSSAGSSFERVN